MSSDYTEVLFFLTVFQPQFQHTHPSKSWNAREYNMRTFRVYTTHHNYPKTTTWPLLPQTSKLLASTSDSLSESSDKTTELTYCTTLCFVGTVGRAYPFCWTSSVRWGFSARQVISKSTFPLMDVIVIAHRLTKTNLLGFVLFDKVSTCSFYRTPMCCYTLTPCKNMATVWNIYGRHQAGSRHEYSCQALNWTQGAYSSMSAYWYFSIIQACLCLIYCPRALIWTGVISVIYVL